MRLIYNFSCKAGRAPTPDCSGAEVVQNLVYGGNGEVAGGAAELEVERGNRLEPLAHGRRPSPTVPSIFEWQRRQRGIPADE